MSRTSVEYSIISTFHFASTKWNEQFSQPSVIFGTLKWPETVKVSSPIFGSQSCKIFSIFLRFDQASAEFLWKFEATNRDCFRDINVNAFRITLVSKYYRKLWEYIKIQISWVEKCRYFKIWSLIYYNFVNRNPNNLVN